MYRSQGGFTILEVMMFLTISAVIFVGAVAAFDGQRGKTNFEQGMRDLASKLQAYGDEVGTSTFPGSDVYNCAGAPSNTRATLSTPGSGAGGIGTNSGCIFLGRAIQFLPGQSILYAYEVLGNQYTSSGDVVTSFAGSLPTPAFGLNNNDLVHSFDTSWGSLSSSKVTTTGGASFSSNLVGIYNSLQDGYNSASAGGQSLQSLGYSYTNGTYPDNGGIKSCIEGSSCSNPPALSSWALCYASTGSSQTALLTVTPTSGGLNTNIQFTSCN